MSSMRWTAVPSSLVARLRRNVRSKAFSNVIFIGWKDGVIPVALFAWSLLWLAKPGTYLYGQDSITFLYPFGPHNSPIISANYNAQSLFFNLVLQGATTAIGSAFLSEQLILASFVGLSALGVVHLLRVVSRVQEKPVDQGFIAKFAAAALYVVNPFSLSVEWQHIQGWTFFPVALPFIIALLVEIHYLGINLRRCVLTLLICLYVAPGLAGAYLFVIAYAFAFFVLLELAHLTLKRISPFTAAKRVLAYVVLGILISGWSSIQYVGSPQFPSQTGAQLVTLFNSESSTTSLFNVLTLTAYSPIQFVPSYFPWIESLPWLIFAGILLLSLLLITLPSTIKMRTVALMTLLTAPVVLVMTGANPPGGFLNQSLLALGGPFDILVNPFYFMAPYYTLYLAYLTYLVLATFIPRAEAGISDWAGHRHIPSHDRITTRNTSQTSETDVAVVRTHVDLPRQGKRATLIACCSIVIVAVSVGIYSGPFFADQVYQPHGNYINELVVPSDYFALANFFEQNYSGPIYNVLVVPTSSAGATYLAYGGSNTFPDSEGLLTQFIPYPTIWRNPQGVQLTPETPLYGAVENATATASQEGGNLLPILSAIHARYVVVLNDFYQNKAMLMAPNGLPYNLAVIQESLNSSLGPPVRIGNFSVYEDPDVTPLVELSNFPDVISTKSITDYFDFLSQLSTTSSNPLVDALQNAIWSSVTLHEGGFVVSQYVGGNQTFLIQAGQVPYFMNSTGSISTSANGTTYADNLVTVQPTVVARGNLSPTFAGNLLYASGRYDWSGPSSGYLLMNGTQFGHPQLTGMLEINLSSTQASDVFTIQSIIDKQMILTINIQHVSESNYLLQATANIRGSSNFGWNNSPLFGPNTFSGPLKFEASITGNQFSFDIQNSSGAWVNDSLYFSANSLDLNGGSDPQYFPEAFDFNPAERGYSLGLYFNGNSSLSDAQLVQVPLVNYVISGPSLASLRPVPYSVSVDASGDYLIHSSPGNLSTLYVGLLTATPGSWQFSAGNGAVSTLVNSNPYYMFEHVNYDPGGNFTGEITLHNYVQVGWESGVLEFVCISVFGTLALAVWGQTRRRPV